MMSTASEEQTAQAWGGRVIYEHSLPNTPEDKQLLDISLYATDGCFRLIDCVAFADEKILRIWEFPQPPLYEHEEYLSCPKFRYSAISYVWKGTQTSAGQGSTNDASAGFLAVKGAEHADPISCFILAGGLQRLVPLDEETPWIGRAWTLQECLAPRYPLVLFAWTYGTGVCQDYEEPFTPSSSRNYAMIWRCALMRTSSRPVDMVFSIMQLMGVTLDPSNFDPHDRLGVTIALASKILDQGGSADWLGLPAKIPPCLQLSTFPQFAKTHVAGEARFLRAGKWCTGRSLDDWAFAYASWDRDTWKQRLYGTMDDKGYLIFTRKACKVVPVLSAARDDCSRWPLLQDTEGLVWLALDESEWLDIDKHTQQQVGNHVNRASKCYMVPLWDFMEPVMANKAEIKDLALANSITKFMLLTEHATGKYHVMSYFYSRKIDGFNDWKERIEHWNELEFAVGGPDPPTMSSEWCREA
ncbi:hypothetical protein MKX07_003871 [Trichoderma sp. CBMAI-0711]|nr:hypothetical protein MKX07_003871 [Trichoderma sp. CBMAI-0711]